MKYLLAVVLFGFVGIGCSFGQNSSQGKNSDTPEGKVTKDLESYFDQLAAENKLSGAVLVAKNGVPIASKAAGVANKANGSPIKLDTKFNLGSLNKMFTAVAISQLAQKGRLTFDDTISKHLPDYPNKEVADKVTIHQLLTHTSGLGSYWNDKFAAQRASLTTVAAHIPLFANDPLSSAPGTKFQYSNAGYMVLGAIVEKLSGKDYYTYVREHIYLLAGMNDTGFYKPGTEIPNLAIGYTKTGPDGKPTDQERDNTDLREVKGGPAGGGYSTVEDLLKFHTALRTNKLLNDEYTKLVTTGKVEAGGPIGKYAYGFGDKMFAGKHIIGHNGGWPGIAANFEMYPELGYTAVLLMNADPPAMMPVIMKIRELLPADHVAETPGP
jgi:CubicO group peptidase (beta-lactamase class C family)